MLAAACAAKKAATRVHVEASHMKLYEMNSVISDTAEYVCYLYYPACSISGLFYEDPRWTGELGDGGACCVAGGQN